MDAIEPSLITVADRNVPLRQRLDALARIERSERPEMIAAVRQLFTRPRPGPQEASINFDPAGIERIVDLHLAVALHRLGDDEELRRIPDLIAQAGTLMRGPEDELEHAAAAVRAAGRTDLIGRLVELAQAGEEAPRRNALNVLDLLAVPEAPVDHPLAPAAPLQRRVSFTINRLRQEMETLERLSNGAIELSPAVRREVAAHDYDRGEVKREDVELAEIVETDVRLLGFRFAQEGPKVRILTDADAAERWAEWWSRVRKALAFEPSGRVVLRRSR